MLRVPWWPTSLQARLLTSRQADQELLQDGGLEQVAEHVPPPLVPAARVTPPLHPPWAGVPGLCHQVVSHPYSLDHTQTVRF